MFRSGATVSRPISRREYAKSVVISSGEYAGQFYRPEIQPVCEIVLSELDRDHWTELYFLWSVQSGKSFSFVLIESGYIIEVLKESQIIALPDETMVKTKWNEIRTLLIDKGSSHLLPLTGDGSKAGGAPSEVTFTNGAKLKFMISGSSDAGKSGFTARHVCVDEIDKQQRGKSSSLETSPIQQYESRMQSYPSRRRRFRGTSTISDEDGFLWTTYQKSSSGGIVLKPCHHCGKFVFPEREHFFGWQDARNELEAMELAYISCPECGGRWNEQDRIKAVRSSVLVHSGQSVNENGEVEGDLPPTLTGFIRANGFDDILGKSIPDIGRQEYLSRSKGSPEESERKIKQFFYAVPIRRRGLDVVELNPDDVCTKEQVSCWRNIVPEGMDRIVVGVDMHSKYLTYVAGAEPEDGSRTAVIDYDEMDSGWYVTDPQTGNRRVSGFETEGKVSWFRMLDRIFERCFVDGWDQGGKKVIANRVYIDARYNKPNSKALNDRLVIEQWIQSLDYCRFRKDHDFQDIGKTGRRQYRCIFCKKAVQIDPGESLPGNQSCMVRTSVDMNGNNHRSLIRMMQGVGSGERERRRYQERSGPQVLALGEGWHLVERDRDGKRFRYWMFDSDRSKLQVQQGFRFDPQTPGSIQLFRVNNENDHRRFALMITAKRWIYDEQKKEMKWEDIREGDHYLDASGMMKVGHEIERVDKSDVIDVAAMDKFLRR